MIIGMSRGPALAMGNGMRYAPRPVVALIAVFLSARPALAGGRPHHPTGTEAERFSAEVTASAQAGWGLGRMEVAEGEDGQARVMLTLTKARWAERFTLVFADGKPVAYARDDAPVPGEARVYRGGPDLLALLAARPLAGVESQCGAWVVFAGDQYAAVDEWDYYTVVRSAAGARAGAALAAVLAEALEQGAQLTDIGRPDDAVDFHLVQGGETLAVHAGLDGAGRVVALEVRRSPGGQVTQHYRGGDELARTLRAGRKLRALAVSEDGTALVGTMAGGKHLVIRLDDVEQGPDTWECPC